MLEHTTEKKNRRFGVRKNTLQQKKGVTKATGSGSANYNLMVATSAIKIQNMAKNNA